jgi:hypothetical protein
MDTLCPKFGLVLFPHSASAIRTLSVPKWKSLRPKELQSCNGESQKHSVEDPCSHDSSLTNACQNVKAIQRSLLLRKLLYKLIGKLFALSQVNASYGLGPYCFVQRHFDLTMSGREKYDIKACQFGSSDPLLLSA